VGSWFYKAIAGINLEEQGTGFSHVAICPNIVGDLTYARSSVNTLRGTIKTSWERKGGLAAITGESPGRQPGSRYHSQVEGSRFDRL